LYIYTFLTDILWLYNVRDFKEFCENLNLNWNLKKNCSYILIIFMYKGKLMCDLVVQVTQKKKKKKQK